MNNPTISVIISTYNRPERLKKAIQSVLNQTFQDFEIIVVHDGMDSGIMPETLDKRIKFIEIEHFGNDTKPKNTGILASKGEYIAFLDDDCEFRPDHLQALYSKLKDNPKISGTYGDRWVVDETRQQEDGLGIYSDFDLSVLLQRNYIDTSDILVRRSELIKVGGFDESQKKYIDWNLWLRMAKSGMVFERVSLVLTDYHLHKDMKSIKVQTKGDKKFGINTPDWDAFDCDIYLPYLGPIEEPKVAVFSLTYDRLEYTKKSFNSLWEKAGYPFEHFIFDNGSKDGTVEWLEEYAKEHEGKVHVIYSEDNKGISIASNKIVDEIMRRKSFKIIMKSDNDCLYTTKGFLSKMVDIWKANNKIALSCYPQGLRDNPGGAMRIGYGKIKGQMVGMTKHIGGICHFVDARAYTFFRWDTHDFLHSLQDLEFSRYLLMNGFQMGYLENYYISHINGTSGQEKDFPEYFERRKKEKTTRYA